MTREPDQVVPFYNAVFGWEPAAMPGGMVVLNVGDKAVASVMTMPAEFPAPTHWQKYIAVDDVAASYAKAVELGAQTFHEPTEIPGMGILAVLADPTGAHFALWKDLSEPS